MIWLLAVLIIVGLAVWQLAPHYLADSGYVPEWHTPRCHGRGCGLGILMAFIVFLFLLLPVWIKLPTALLAIGELLVHLIAFLVWSFDRRPDLAIGPHGIYGFNQLGYHHVPWSNVGGVVLQRNITLFGTTHSLTIYTRQKPRKSALEFWRKPKPIRFSLIPLYGFNISEIIDSIHAYAPDKKVRTNDVDTRPKWLR